MKINNLKINSFGNLNDKEIIFSDNINIIKGNNESGKSTLLKFIIDMFYGISKNKRGKEFSDYDKYKPWNTDEFSGKIKYTLKDGSSYEIFRDFNKKNPKIYNEKLEEISKNFNINKQTGNEFFINQTNIDENVFLSTLASSQQEVKLDKTTQNTLIQKVANFVSTGDDAISYKKAIEKINKKQLEEIGTERSQGRPINIINEKKEKIEIEKKELINLKNNQYEIEELKNKIEKEIIEDEKKLNLIKEINLIKEKEKIENEKIILNKKIIFENEQEIKKLTEQKKLIEDKKENKKTDDEINLLKNNLKEINYGSIKKIEENYINKCFKQQEKDNIMSYKKDIENIENKLKIESIIFLFVIIMLIVISIINFMFTKKQIINQILLTASPIVVLTYILAIFYKKRKIKIKKEELSSYINRIIDEANEYIKTENFEVENELHKINAQIEILKNGIQSQEENVKEIEEEKNKKLNLEKEKIKNSYIKKINNENNLIIEKIKNEINNYFEKNNLEDEIIFLENKLNKNKLQIHSLELDKNNLIPKLEKLANMEEELEELKEKEKYLLKYNESMELTKKILEIAYNKMRDVVTPKFTNNLSKNISKISNGKYNKVRLNDEEGLIVEKENGEYITAEKLSVGTIEQLYLSLRFALVNEITQEAMPIILDEAFAYYDEERLKNILVYLNNEYKENQIIIFTCTNREIEILEKENINYNLINI